MSKTFLLIGGLYNIGFVIFHMLFWKIFQWKEDLRSISYVNRAIMQVLNIRLTYVFVVFAYISIIHLEDLISTQLGNTILVAISLFWFMRAIEQIKFFGIKNKYSAVLFVIFLIGSIIYAIPLIV